MTPTWSFLKESKSKVSCQCLRKLLPLVIRIRIYEMLVPQLWIFHRRRFSAFLFNIVLCIDMSLNPSTPPVPGPPGSIYSVLFWALHLPLTNTYLLVPNVPAVLVPFSVGPYPHLYEKLSYYFGEYPQILLLTPSTQGSTGWKQRNLRYYLSLPLCQLTLPSSPFTYLLKSTTLKCPYTVHCSLYT